MFCRQSTVPRCLKFIPISCTGSKHAPKDTDLIFNQFICTGACACSSNLNYAQNALKTQLMHKNVQTNPEKSQKLTQQSYCSMLTQEKFESNKRQWISFRPQRWDVPYQKPSCLLWEAPVCEKHIPKPAANGTKFVPRHVDAAPW